MDMLSPPVLIMAVLIGIFFFSLIIFVVISKKSEKQEKASKSTDISKLEIDMQEASKADFDSPVEEKVEEAPTPTEPESVDMPQEEPKSVSDETPDIMESSEPEESGVQVDMELDDAEKMPEEIAIGNEPFDLESDEIEVTDSDAEGTFDEDEGAESVFAFDDADGGDFSFDSSNEIKDASDESLWEADGAEKTPEKDDEGLTPEDIFEDKPASTDLPPEAAEDLFGSGNDAIEEEFEVTPDNLDIVESIVGQAEPEVSLFDDEPDPVTPPPAPEPKPEPEPEAAPPAPVDPEEEKRHEKTKRIARVIVNDIRNYNPDKLAEGIQIGNIMKTLGVEIERGRQLYIKRVPQEIAKTTNYYREALVKLLADGRTDLFGW